MVGVYMNKIERLNNLKLNAMNIIKAALLYMKYLQPLNNPEFMNETEKRTLDSYKVIINNINNEYDELYKSLSVEERREHEYKNILGEFNRALRTIESIDMVYNGDDEYELHDKLSKAYKYGMTAVEEKIEAEKRNDNITVLKCNRILAACSMTFKGHFWGESYQKDLDNYETRLRSGRTIEDDIHDFETIYSDALDLSIRYAKDLEQGMSDMEKDNYFNLYRILDARAREALRFVPRGMIPEQGYNSINWLRIEAQENQKAFIEKYDPEHRVK